MQVELEIQAIYEDVAICPGGPSADAAAAEYDNCDDGNDENGVILLLFGFFNNRGHLFFHDLFSL